MFKYKYHIVVITLPYTRYFKNFTCNIPDRFLELSFFIKSHNKNLKVFLKAINSDETVETQNVCIQKISKSDLYYLHQGNFYSMLLLLN